MLKKEFKKKDVNRARNLIMGKTGDSTGTQIGYNKKVKDYKEGDIWTENKKTWTIKNGIKQTVSKLDSVRNEVFIPLCCPKCSKVMKHHLDKSNFKTHKKCWSCVIEFEHKLKIEGKYKEYIENLKQRNNLSIIDETESYLLDAINTSNEGYVSEDGVVERWVGGVDKKEFTKKIKEAAKVRREHINKKLNESKK